MTTDLILTCAEPGCSRITRALIQVDGWLCWEHAPSAGWPERDEPCSDDFECGTTCTEDDDAFVYETNIEGADVMCICQCEHHR